MSTELLQSKKFRLSYALCQASVVYFSVYCLCYYWPLFVKAVFFLSENSSLKLLVSITTVPSGFLVLTCLFGKAVFIANISLFAILITSCWLATDQFQDTTQLMFIWINGIRFLYASGALLSALHLSQNSIIDKKNLRKNHLFQEVNDGIN